MGNIMSAESEIDGIEFVQIDKGRPRNAARVMKVDDGCYLVQLDTGQFSIVGHHSHLNKPVAMLGFGGDGSPGQQVLSGLVKMGVISAGARDRHVARVNASSEEKRREWAVGDLQRACAVLGIEVPALPEGDAA